ncbi:DEAD/DEAH box helicase family protein [Natronosalvus amylolyticus]|uniref:DEAD/DEAH box helicase family protein n=1 Tax=Natronosalvus amylolyticus TaxID=2961994 RepID=UPI0020C9D1CA|nr:DEAD/DEAH box helicase family protein [Natronosalvus amylolyticus]
MTERLEHRLVLCDYFYELFGQNDFDDLQEKLRDIEEGFTEDGHSYFFHVLTAIECVQIPEQKLADYDLNIKEYMEKINRVRDRPIQLKYFQYLAALFTEIYLDAYFNRKDEFLDDLNAHLQDWNTANTSRADYVLSYQKEDLCKLAFWMATGSGKTIIFHINYHQFLQYNDADLDNIILITPREELTEQHIKEMRKDNIPCSAFNKEARSLFANDDQEVKVIDIHKLNEEAGEKTVNVDAFEGNNLVFVDEGHKGSGGDVWMDQRSQVVSDGFVFEYSATFGQAINAANNKTLLEEYSKAILFDYSYNYFFQDGYGKDYRILNLDTDVSKDVTDTWLLGNLLSFYEQMRYYEENEGAVKDYKLERPLWIFVGGRVNAIYTRHGEKTSDVLTVLQFLQRFLSDAEWAEDRIQELLNGTSGLESPDGRNVFEEGFTYLDDHGLTAAEIYADALTCLFHVEGPSHLQVAELKEEDDELGVKAANSDAYFGVVNIGDTSAFQTLVEDHAEEITQDEDEFTQSLFDNIKDGDSNVNILLGSKKFIEGWDTWRVSNMGLMNVGKSEGSEVIQLFGRGVRLKGKEFSLKRSSRLKADDQPPEHIEILETLNIFGVQADYMRQFREYLEEEGIEPEYWKRDLEVRVKNDLLDEGLKVPRVDDDREFKQEATVALTLDSDVCPRVDRRPQVQVLESVTETSHATEESDQERTIPDTVIPLLDWNEIYFEILQHKRQKELTNLALDKDVLREIIEEQAYTLHCRPADVNPDGFSDLEDIQRLVEILLKSYVDEFYSQKQESWESQHLSYQTLDAEDRNFPDNYTLTIPESNEAVIETVTEVLEEATEVYERDLKDFPNVYFDKHLYQPLFTTDPQFESISPVGLNNGEEKFVEDLRDYVQNDWNDAIDGDQVFLLRNLSQKGVGFFEAGNFYPDFILWIKNGAEQRVVFVDPKGLQHIGIHHKKIQFYKTVKKIQERLDDDQVVLESFIISNTSPDKAEETHGLSKEEFEDHHVLFQDDPGAYIGQLFSKIQ